MDLNKRFDKEVWLPLVKAREAMETAICNAGRLGLIQLAEQISAAREPVLHYLSECARISPQMNLMYKRV